MASVRGIAWAAGFLEGDGCFNFNASGTPQISAVQVHREPLDRVSDVLGGKVTAYKHRRTNGGVLYVWRMAGAKAAGAMFTLYTDLSSRRRAKIREVIAEWRLKCPGKGSANRAKTHCPRGHPYSGDNLILQQSKGYRSRVCRTCRKEQARHRYQNQRGIGTGARCGPSCVS